MSQVIVVGSQWGDEGKAKVIDFLSECSDVIIRFQGGANAGHTVVVDNHKFVFHMVPSGIVYPDKICLLGNGVVFDMQQFCTEVDELEKSHISVTDRLFISDIAHLVLPYHKIIDALHESSMNENKIGTTKRGIGPAYADKANRIGLRTCDLVEWSSFTRKLEQAFIQKKRMVEEVYRLPFECDLTQTLSTLKELRDRIVPLLRDTAEFTFAAMRDKKSILFEGAQGTFLDIDHGTYPYVTSSNTIAGAACTGAGIGPTFIDQCIGIVKAYTTRVGNGPFPTELTDALGEKLREEGGEFGATTGRPRRCGWFDAVMVRKAIQLNGITSIALTKLDILNNFKEIRICTRYEVRGKKVDSFPSTPAGLCGAVPIYETMQGWNCPLTGCKKFDDLPENAARYVLRLQSLCYNVPLYLVSIGPERSQTIRMGAI